MDCPTVGVKLQIALNVALKRCIVLCNVFTPTHKALDFIIAVTRNTHRDAGTGVHLIGGNVDAGAFSLQNHR